jgi:hypothetical protein
VRALFADEILLQITTQFFSDADGEAAVSTVYRDVSELMAAAIRLVRDLLVLYFSRLPPGVVQKVPISTEEHH